MITDTPKERIEEIVASQRQFFRSHATLPIEFRLEALGRLRRAIVEYEEQLCGALYKDLHKSYEEAYLTELSIVLGEIDGFLKNLKRWAKPSKKSATGAAVGRASRR